MSDALYTYMLLSHDQGRFYTGYTGNLRKRLQEHHGGRVRWTASRRPVRLADYEACLGPEDALRRERDLKSGKHKRYLRNRLGAYLSSVSRNKLERHSSVGGGCADARHAGCHPHRQ